MGGRTIANIRFADDIDGSAGEEEELANLVEEWTFCSQYTLSVWVRVCVVFSDMQL